MITFHESNIKANVPVYKANGIYIVSAFIEFEAFAIYYLLIQDYILLIIKAVIIKYILLTYS